MVSVSKEFELVKTSGFKGRQPQHISMNKNNQVMRYVHESRKYRYTCVCRGSLSEINVSAFGHALFPQAFQWLKCLFLQNILGFWSFDAKIISCISQERNAFCHISYCANSGYSQVLYADMIRVVFVIRKPESQVWKSRLNDGKIFQFNVRKKAKRSSQERGRAHNSKTNWN